MTGVQTCALPICHVAFSADKGCGEQQNEEETQQINGKNGHVVVFAGFARKNVLEELGQVLPTTFQEFLDTNLLGAVFGLHSVCLRE